MNLISSTLWERRRKRMLRNRYRLMRLLTALWMVFIFVMSAMPSEESSEQSGLVVRVITDAAEVILGPGTARQIPRDHLEHVIRKLAHFSEYAILYLLVFHSFGANARHVAPIALGITVLYAGGDEIHQYFVPGRAMALTDVMIDSSGALTALLGERLFSRIKGKKNKMKE